MEICLALIVFSTVLEQVGGQVIQAQPTVTQTPTQPQPLEGEFTFLTAPTPGPISDEDDVMCDDEEASYWPFPGYVTPPACRRCFNCYDCIARYTGKLCLKNVGKS